MCSSKPQPLSNSPEPSGERLDSWKEIAAYLKRDERTVRRWEKEGLPVHRKVHKKQASVFAYRAEIDSWWNDGRQRLDTVERPTVGKRSTVRLLGGIGAAIALTLAVFYGIGLRKQRWARNQALPEIARLIDEGKLDKGFRLTLESQRYIPNDPVLLRLVNSFTKPVSVQTDPPGADVYVRTYSATDDDWSFLGKSPIKNVRVPWEYLRWRITKKGFETIEAASDVLPNVTLDFTLSAPGVGPAGMVRVPGGVFQFRSAAPKELDVYWLDKYEVTNRQFKDFIEHGGYQKQSSWKQEFIKDDRQLSWEEAMALFRDSTGRSAPSTWELGSFPEDQADLPVSGVSWYEAAAYCEWMGKSLPTVYHWYKAAGIGIASDILQFSNFAGKGPARVGAHSGMGPYGTYDMAGNVKEWAWNKTGSKRYILGGAWSEPAYTFATEDAEPPFSRAPTYGFRCAKYSSPPTAVLTDPIDTLARDYTKEKAVTDSVFSFYKSLYTYDRTDLEARVESVDDSSKYWRREKVSFAAAYGNERVTAYLFLPKNAKPPYATVIYFPGVSSFFEASSENINPGFLEPVIRSGRAGLYPIYMGTYERHLSSVPVRQTEEVVQPGSACLPVGPNAARDLVAQWARDLGRSIDYLQTRKEIDSRSLGYYGLSLGAVWGPVLTAVEPRLKVSVLVGGGLPFEKLPGEIEPFKFRAAGKDTYTDAERQGRFSVSPELFANPSLSFLGYSSRRKAPSYL